MEARILAFPRKQSPAQDWTTAELAELYRVVDILGKAGVDTFLDMGLSDEGDPWLVVCRSGSADVLAHFARIDGQFVAASAAIDETFRGANFRQIIDRLARSQPLLVPLTQPAGGAKLYMHPSVVLTAFVATALALGDGPDLGPGHAVASGLEGLGLAGEGAARAGQAGDKLLRAEYTAATPASGAALPAATAAGHGASTVAQTVTLASIVAVALAAVQIQAAAEADTPAAPASDSAPSGQRELPALPAAEPVQTPPADRHLPLAEGDPRIAGLAEGQGPRVVATVGAATAHEAAAAHVDIAAAEQPVAAEDAATPVPTHAGWLLDTDFALTMQLQRPGHEGAAAPQAATAPQPAEMGGVAHAAANLGETAAATLAVPAVATGGGAAVTAEATPSPATAVSASDAAATTVADSAATPAVHGFTLRDVSAEAIRLLFSADTELVFASRAAKTDTVAAGSTVTVDAAAIDTAAPSATVGDVTTTPIVADAAPAVSIDAPAVTAPANETASALPAAPVAPAPVTATPAPELSSAMSSLFNEVASFVFSPEHVLAVEPELTGTISTAISQYMNNNEGGSLRLVVFSSDVLAHRMFMFVPGVLFVEERNFSAADLSHLTGPAPQSAGDVELIGVIDSAMPA